MLRSWRQVWIVARHELSDSIRSRRVMVLFLLYVAGSVAGTAMFIQILQKIERHLVESLGIAVTANTGNVTAVLWKSDFFRHMMTQLVGDRSLAESLLAIPPVAVYYGWLSFAFAPALVMLTSAARISEELFTGSIRFVAFRVSRAEWCAGKIVGQAGQIFLALMLSAMAAWITGRLRMNAFEPVANAQAMLVFAGKAWIYSMAFLGLATGVSQLIAAPNLALAVGFFSLIGLTILSEVSKHFAGDGWLRLWDLVNQLTPGGHRLNLWWGDLAHQLPATVFLFALGLAYFGIGYARFSKRDL